MSPGRTDIRNPERHLRKSVADGDVKVAAVTRSLSPRAAKAVRAIAKGERPSLPDGRLDPADDRGFLRVKKALSPAYPTLGRLLRRGALSPSEALKAAQAIDRAIGRYLTGTRYAAP